MRRNEVDWKQNIMKGRVFIAWKKYCTRSQNIAEHLGAKNVYIYPFSSDGSIWKTIARYVISFFATMSFLLKQRPHMVFLLNQPPPLLIVTCLYTKLVGGEYILDSHSAPFNDIKWAWFRPFYKRIAAKAFFNINTNTHHKNIVESWGGRSFVIGDVPIDFNHDYPLRKLPKISVAVVASFMFDEPLEEVWAAARMKPDIDFYVTGNYKKANKRLIQTKPPNIKLTGFLLNEDYLGLLLSVKCVVALTTRDNTMQRGAYEALSLEVPIVTSNWTILRESFGDGAAYVDNSTDSIAKGVQKIIDNHESFKKKVILHRKNRLKKFKETQNQIINFINSA